MENTLWASKIHLRYILDTCITLRPGSQDTAQSSRWAEIPPMTRNTLWYIMILNCNTLWYTYPIHASRCVLEPRSQWATWYIINTYKYVQIHVLPRTNVCVWIRYIKHTPIHFLIRVSLCIVAAVVIHTEGAPLLLPVSIQVSPGPKQPLGRGLRLVMYRFVSFSIEESRYSRMYWYRFEYWANEGTRHRKRYMTTHRYDTQRYKTTQCTEYNGRNTVKIHIQRATIHKTIHRSRGYKTDFEGKDPLPTPKCKESLVV